MKTNTNAATMFVRAAPVTGQHEICIVTTETGYFEFEQEAQRCGKTVEQYVYDEMAHQFRARGYNISPDCFYVTTELPDETDTGKPPARRVTVQ
jgi:hypothetical protein